MVTVPAPHARGLEFNPTHQKTKGNEKVRAGVILLVSPTVSPKRFSQGQCQVPGHCHHQLGPPEVRNLGISRWPQRLRLSPATHTSSLE